MAWKIRALSHWYSPLDISRNVAPSFHTALRSSRPNCQDNVMQLQYLLIWGRYCPVAQDGHHARLRTIQYDERISARKKANESQRLLLWSHRCRARWCMSLPLFGSLNSLYSHFKHKGFSSPSAFKLFSKHKGSFCCKTDWKMKVGMKSRGFYRSHRARFV